MFDDFGVDPWTMAGWRWPGMAHCCQVEHRCGTPTDWREHKTAGKPQSSWMFMGKSMVFLGFFCLTQSIVPCKSYFSKVNQAMQIAFPPALGENQPGKPGGTLQDIAPGVWTATFIVTTLPTAMASRCLGQWCGAVMREACGNWKSQLAETLCSYGNIWRYNLLGSLIDVLSRFSHIHVGIWWRALFDRNL